jgi:hypothetical protein
MKKWDLATYYVNIVDRKGYDPSNIWTRKNKDGKTDWDTLADYALQGWELVSVTPIGFEGNTKYVLYTFKREKE